MNITPEDIFEIYENIGVTPELQKAWLAYKANKSPDGPFEQIPNSYVVLKMRNDGCIVCPVYKRGNVFHTKFGGFYGLYEDGRTSSDSYVWDEIELAGATGVYL
jgi:hypothetical protein